MGAERGTRCCRQYMNESRLGLSNSSSQSLHLNPTFTTNLLPPWLMYDPVDCCCNPFRETKAWLTFNLELINTFYKGNYFPLEKGMTQDNRVWDAKMLLYCLANMLFQWMSFEWISGLTMWTPWVESEGVCGKTSNICKIWTRIWVQGRGDHMTLITLWNLLL